MNNGIGIRIDIKFDICTYLIELCRLPMFSIVRRQKTFPIYP